MTENAVSVAEQVEGEESTNSPTSAADSGQAKPEGGQHRNGGSSKDALLVAEGDAAADYLEGLLYILDLDSEWVIDLDVEGERAVVAIMGDGEIDKLVGDHGEVLDALQELSRLAVMAETGQRSRLMLDIAGYRARRRTELGELGRTTAEQVAASGEPVRLAPMNPFERKVVHDAVGTVAGVASSSEGEEPRRRVVISPAS
ncbi:MAG: R3H domain-containing nucleic acid-binding protein [Nakamurella sp.]